MDEKEFVINSFKRNFEDFKQCNIVIYGLGKNTQTVLEECKDFNIVGLMDGTCSEGMKWNLNIVSYDDLLKMNDIIIVIIATSANVPIIFKRIKDFCKNNMIKVFDINGNLLGEEKGEYVLSPKYERIKKEILLKKIDDADVVSLDIFDTLLVRNVLYPTDVFELIELENRKIIPEGFDYKANRIRAERDLYIHMNPTINDIYDYMKNQYDLPLEIAEILKIKELNKEECVISSREGMIDIVRYAESKGKILCCTSDMYLTSDFLRNLLKKNGYGSIKTIIVSCENGVSKCNGLFEVLKNKYKGKRILHIGDNFDADIRGAINSGIDDTFEIASGYQMLQHSSFGFIEDDVQTLGDRRILGEFVARLLKNPFLFESTRGRVNICDNYSLGYYYFEPMIQAFMSWLISTVEKEDIDILLLGARDGWLIKDLLDIYNKKKKVKFEYHYFYASRLACTLAGMDSKKDVRYAASLAFSGKTEELLKQRFLLREDEIKERSLDETDEDYFDRHIDFILEKSKQYRNNYLEYLKRINLEDRKIGFFDFVSSGTCQLWLEKITGHKMQGFYFLKNNDDYKKHLCIKSMYKPKFVYEEQSKLYKDYVFLESILTSPEPTLKQIGVEGQCIFEKENRSAKMIDDLKQIHVGIKDGYRRRFEYEDISHQFAEDLVDLVRPKYSDMKVDFFKENTLLDEFCNRAFELKNEIFAAE